jgi:hypothetical protein
MIGGVNFSTYIWPTMYWFVVFPDLEENDYQKACSWTKSQEFLQ